MVDEVAVTLKGGKEGGEPEVRQVLKKIEGAANTVIREKLGPVMPGQSLAENRRDTCYLNDNIAEILNREGMGLILAWSNSTGRNLSGEYCEEVPHQHGVILVEVPGSNKLIVTDISGAQFAAVNSEIGEKELVTVVCEKGEEETVLQNLYGGGDWNLEIWKRGSGK